MTAKKAPKPVPMISVEDAISMAYGTLGELRDELQSWRDNLPENMQSGDKADQLDEAVSGLEEACDYEPSVPPCFEDADTTDVRFPEPKLPNRASRAARRDWAVSLMRDAVSTIQQWRDDQTSAEAEIEFRDAIAERPAAAIDSAWEEHVVRVEDEVETFTDEVEGHADAVEDVEFPGMRG